MSEENGRRSPAFQFYPGDWKRDSALQSCSLMARGLWIEMLCVMHDGHPYGHLSVGHKDTLKDIPVGSLAHMIGVSLTDLETGLRELEDAGVFSRTASGCIYSRRMVNDYKLRQVRAAGGVRSLENPNVPRPKDTFKDTLDTVESPILEDALAPAIAIAEDIKYISNKKLRPRKARTEKPPDDEWVTSLAANPAYVGIDVRRELNKALVWYENAGRACTRRCFINWLNRAERPLHGNGRPAKRDGIAILDSLTGGKFSEELNGTIV